MNNSLKQVPGTPEEVGSKMPMLKSGIAKKIALVGTLVGSALSNIGCEPFGKDPRRNRPVANAKDVESKESQGSNMESMADIDGLGVITSTEDVLGYGKAQPEKKQTYEPPKVEGGVRRDKNYSISF